MWSRKSKSTVPASWRSRLRRLLRSLSSLRIGHQLGLVLTEKSVRLCLVKQVLHRRRIVETLSLPLDPQETSTWPRRVEAAVTAISGFLQERNLSAVPINVGLVGDNIAFRRMYLPRMSGKELASAILWEGQKLIPFELDQCLVYHEKVDFRNQGGVDQFGVNLTAVKREIVETLYDRIEAAGYRIGQVDFIPAVVADALPSRISADREKHRLVLLLDDDQSLALFVHRGHLDFYQQFVTNPLPDDDGRMMNTAAVAVELTTFLDLYNGQQFGNAVDDIVLAGKYAGDPDTVTALSAATGLPCIRLADSDGLAPALRSDEAAAGAMLDVIATGLADVGRHPLIPGAARRKVERKKMALRMASAAMLILMLVGNFHAQSLLMNQRLRRNLDSARNSTRAYESSTAYHAYLSFLADMNRQKNRQAQLQSRHASHFHLLLKELSLTIPDDISLTKMEFSDKNNARQLRLEGVVSLVGFSPEIVLAQYVETLGKSPFFENIAIERHLKKQENGRFDLSFVLEMGARI